MTVNAQNLQHMDMDLSAKKDEGMEMMDHTGMHGGMDMDMENMSSSFSRNLSMSRNGSGTGWLPDASPVYGIMYHSKKWM